MGCGFSSPVHLRVHLDEYTLLDNDCLCGFVFLDNLAEVNLRALNLEIRGEEVFSGETDSSGSVINRTIIIQPGQHRFPYKCQLPGKIPGSFNKTYNEHWLGARRCRIAYQAVATAVLKGLEIVPPACVTFTVLPRPCTTAQSVVQACDASVTRDSGTDKGHMSAELVVMSDVVEPGGLLELYIKVDNLSSVPVECVNAQLVNEIRAHYGSSMHSFLCGQGRSFATPPTVLRDSAQQPLLARTPSSLGERWSCLPGASAVVKLRLMVLHNEQGTIMAQSMTSTYMLRVTLNAGDGPLFCIPIHVNPGPAPLLSVPLPQAPADGPLWHPMGERPIERYAKYNMNQAWHYDVDL